MDTMSEDRRQTELAEAESHRKMIDLCWEFRARLEHLQPGLSLVDYTYAQALKSFLLKARGI